jgi:hypothetical protein
MGLISALSLGSSSYYQRDKYIKNTNIREYYQPLKKVPALFGS